MMMLMTTAATAPFEGPVGFPDGSPDGSSDASPDDFSDDSPDDFSEGPPDGSVSSSTGVELSALSALWVRVELKLLVWLRPSVSASWGREGIVERRAIIGEDSDCSG